MEEYYTGGYYLVELKPIENGKDKGKYIYTSNPCYNTSAYDDWVLSNVYKNQIEKIPKIFEIDENKLNDINKWADKKFFNDEILQGPVLPNLDISNEFKNLFYKNRNDIEVLRIDFSKTEAERLIKEFAPGANPEINLFNGEMELRRNLIKRENRIDSNMEFIGFDIIGIECDGSYHNYDCFDIHDRLFNKFDLRINKYLLIENIENPTEISDYFNKVLCSDVEYEFYFWYVVKVYRLKQ